jgi:FtsH-binding integral membrane protein
VFQEGAKKELVQAGHRLTATALVLIGVLLGGILFLVVDMVYDRAAAAAGGVAAVVVLAVLLLVLPTRVSRGKDAD